MGIAKIWLGFASSSARNSRAQLLTALHCRGPYGGFHVYSESLATAQPDEYAQHPQSLGARMSFVVEEIDNIHRQNLEKGAALEKLRAWKDRNNNYIKTSAMDSTTLEGEKGAAAASQGFETGEVHLPSPRQVDIAHPWPDWIELLERLVEQNYFDKRRANEDQVIEKMSRGKNAYGDESFDIFKDFTAVRNACLDFGRDRFDILRSLSRKDIQIIVGYGCPSLDRKVVSSGKRLRAYVHLDEGDVCSTCKLRGSCEKAYLVPREDDGARTLDVMRILLTFGLDPVCGSAENKLHMRKTVKASVCRLLKEVAKLSGIPLDPNLPKPVFKRPPPKVKQPQPPPRKRVGRDDIEMKAGDWLCPKCDFMNFAKNHNCLQCDVKRPKRQLNPGEWECPRCNFLNYRRNMTCYNCDVKRPKDDYTNGIKHGRDGNLLDNISDFQRTEYSTSRRDKQHNMMSTSKDWNDDFDDDESDGADVAAFEYADSPLLNCDREGRQKGGGFDNDTFDFEDLPVYRKGRITVQDEKGGWKKVNTGKDLETDRWSSSSNGVEKAFDDFDEDEDGYGLNGTHGGRAYEKYEMASTNCRRDGRVYDSDDTDDNNQCSSIREERGSKAFERPSLSSPRGRVQKTYDNFGDFEEDDNESSFESDDEPSHLSEMKWRKGKEARSILRRDRGTWNKIGHNDTSRKNSHESEDEPPHLYRTNWSRGKNARSPGRGMEGNQNSKRRGDSFRGSPYKFDRGPSFHSRDKGRVRNNDDFEDKHSVRGNYGRANERRGAGRMRNRNSAFKLDWGPSFSSGERGRVKNSYDFEDGCSAKKSYGRANESRGAAKARNGRGLGDSLRGSSFKPERVASFSSRERGRAKNNS